MQHSSDNSVLISRLQDPARFDHDVFDLQVVETHISWVILTGPYAYKIKKPVDLGFLDFSTLAKRHHYCEEELRLNKRLAPMLYLEVIPITGDPEHPLLGGDGEAIDYAVKMKQFPVEAQLDRFARHQPVDTGMMIDLARTVARFHQTVPSARTDTPYGDPDTIAAPMRENFPPVREIVESEKDKATLEGLERYTDQQLDNLRPLLMQRKQQGYIRECHGDLHLANIAVIDDKAVPFDCIEFSETLRWIDVISDLSFLTMDLDHRGLQHHRRRVLNAYLEETGDYGALDLLRFYQVYRCLVRAKVDCIRQTQLREKTPDRPLETDIFRSYLDLALRYTRRPTTPLIINHGFSGSGKTSITNPLLTRYDAIRIRSDIERKRLHGLAATDRSGAERTVDSGMYSRSASADTYNHLAGLAREIIHGGYPVIVDATFLKQHQRQQFRELAAELAVPFVILDYQASTQQLEEWIRQRQATDKDASDATIEVLHHQLESHEPLTPEELSRTIIVNTETNVDIEGLVSKIKKLAG